MELITKTFFDDAKVYDAGTYTEKTKEEWQAEIEKLIQQLAREGISVLYISSEIEELVRGCDRIAVLREGSVFGELFGEEITSDNLLHMIAGEDTAKTGGE